MLICNKLYGRKGVVWETIEHYNDTAVKYGISERRRNNEGNSVLWINER